MTKREAIRECKRLWKEIVGSGLGKRKFLWETNEGKKWLDKGYDSECPLCEYDNAGCDDCPLHLQYGESCTSLGYSRNPKTFYEYVKGLKE